MANSSYTLPLIFPWWGDYARQSTDISRWLIENMGGMMLNTMNDLSFEKIFGDSARLPEYRQTALDLLIGPQGAADMQDEYYEAKDLYRMLAGESSLPSDLSASRPRGIAGPGTFERAAEEYIGGQFARTPDGRLIFRGWRPEQEGEALSTARETIGSAARLPNLRSIGDPSRNELLQNAMDIWERTQGEKMLNQATLMGLGRSTGTLQAIANARQQAMQPMIDRAIELENEAINRELGARNRLSDYLMQAAQNEMAREGQAYNRGWEIAQRQSGRLQAAEDAAYEELMNRRNLWANTLGSRLSALTGAAGGLMDVSNADVTRRMNVANLLNNLAMQDRSLAMQPGFFNFGLFKSDQDWLRGLFTLPMENVPFGSYVSQNEFGNVGNWTGDSNVPEPSIPPWIRGGLRQPRGWLPRIPGGGGGNGGGGGGGNGGSGNGGGGNGGGGADLPIREKPRQATGFGGWLGIPMGFQAGGLGTPYRQPTQRRVPGPSDWLMGYSWR